MIPKQSQLLVPPQLIQKRFSRIQRTKRWRIKSKLMFRSQWGTFLDPLWIVTNTPLRSTTNQNKIFNLNLIWLLINQSGPLHCDFKNKPKLNKSALLYTYGIETKALFFECLSQDFTQKNWKYTFPLVCKRTVSLSWTVISSWQCSALTTAFRLLGDTICV
jgi:hypothetical protein